jgi:2-polyprenyl-6-methoxyphenol hydroxylase-like FAD-dependent oxidoreductase
MSPGIRASRRGSAEPYDGSMRIAAVAVLGAGISGLSTALLLARSGRHVTLIERDAFSLGNPTEAVNWTRSGIPHFLQPHAFTARGRRELRELLPDVFDSLVDAGANDIDLRPKLQVADRPGDEELAIVGVRRPLIEWALRQAALNEPTIRVVSGVRVVGLLGTAGEVPTITGVSTSGPDVAAELVIDAMGRRSPVPDWIEALGGRQMAERSSDCGVIYYSRYYRVRPGASLPDGPWLPTPRADLGYGLFSSFPGDNGTFAALVAVPPGDQELKILRNASAFEAATARMPALHSWTNADTSVPITNVLPMGSLRNSLRTLADDRLPALGLVSIGDALCHTDPVFALGLSFGLVHARALTAALDEHGSDLASTALAFYEAVREAMEERFANATAVDELRLRAWTGEQIDIAHADGGAYPYFAFAAGGAAALHDDEVFRTVVRRNYFLDPLSVLDDDPEMQQRIERVFGELRATPRPAPGPTRADLLAAMLVAL